VSPTLRDHRLSLTAPSATRPEPRRAVVYAWSLVGVALALVVPLFARGEVLPDAGLLLVLAIPLAMCMNRYLFFPNEIGVTADAAVLFAAIVAFDHQAPWLGPLCLALLVGPLDARHWGARAWTRMAYNSGSTAITTAAGCAAFAVLSTAFGSGWEATLGAAALAAVPYVIVELVLGVGLVSLLGERAADALRHQAPLVAIALPLSIVGAIAGLLALDVGWWSAVLVLLPVPFVPELAFVVLRRRSRAARVAAAGLVLFVVSLVVTGPLQVVVALLALALLAGAECRVRASFPLPVLGAVVVVAVAVVGPEREVLVATLVAVLAVVGARWSADTTGRRVTWSRLGWSIPVGAAAWIAAQVWRALGGRPGSLAFVALFVAVLVVAAAWGTPPWVSRYVGPWAHAVLGRSRRRALVGTWCVGLAFAVLEALGPPGGAVFGLVVACATSALVAIAANAVYQWRFSPRRRRREGVLVVALAGAVVATTLGGDRTVSWSVLALTGIVATVIAWPLAPDLGRDTTRDADRASSYRSGSD
jgi:hypothetical protein